MLTLPRGHSDSELQLARRVARQLGSEDLHVFWSERTAPPHVRLPALPDLALGLAVFGAVIDVLSSALGLRRSGAKRPLA